MSAAQLNQMTGAVNQLMTGIASEFSTSVSYAVDSYCMYEGQLYRFTSAHSAGAWNSSHVTAVSKITNEIARKLSDAPSDNKEYVRKNGAWSESSGGGGGTWGSITGTLSNQTDLQSALNAKADVSILADGFSPSTTYAIGDYCIANGALYRFTAAHTGNWAWADVTQVVAMDELEALQDDVDALNTEVNGKQDTLSWDTAPTSGGTNPMKSGAIYAHEPFQVTGNASAGSSVTFTDSRIDSDHWRIPKGGIYFGTGANVTTDVHWVTNPTNHTVTLEATFSGATTVAIDMIWFQ